MLSCLSTVAKFVAKHIFKSYYLLQGTKEGCQRLPLGIWTFSVGAGEAKSTTVGLYRKKRTYFQRLTYCWFTTWLYASIKNWEEIWIGHIGQLLRRSWPYLKNRPKYFIQTYKIRSSLNTEPTVKLFSGLSQESPPGKYGHPRNFIHPCLLLKQARSYWQRSIISPDFEFGSAVRRRQRSVNRMMHPCARTICELKSSMTLGPFFVLMGNRFAD